MPIYNSRRRVFNRPVFTDLQSNFEEDCAAKDYKYNYDNMNKYEIHYSKPRYRKKPYYYEHRKFFLY